ncbi:MAG: hypothetical protein C4527_21130 [Candidatus Omnitrophota bacterium]|nr:MAG: hypothetical protein C4527_21130 [Candidatus Omnitrophota bacterium]
MIPLYFTRNTVLICEKGRIDGYQDKIIFGWELKFGNEGMAVSDKIKRVHSLGTLKKLESTLRTATDMKAVYSLLVFID